MEECWAQNYANNSLSHNFDSNKVCAVLAPKILLVKFSVTTCWVVVKVGNMISMKFCNMAFKFKTHMLNCGHAPNHPTLDKSQYPLDKINCYKNFVYDIDMKHYKYITSKFEILNYLIN